MRVTNQNFKKKNAKFLIINKAKIESKKNHRKKSLDDVTTAVTTCTHRGPCTVVCARATLFSEEVPIPLNFEEYVVTAP